MEFSEKDNHKFVGPCGYNPAKEQLLKDREFMKFTKFLCETKLKYNSTEWSDGTSVQEKLDQTNEVLEKIEERLKTL
jgi:hypothetical protein